MLLVKVIIFVMTAIRNNKYDVYLCHSYNHANGVDIVRDTTIAPQLYLYQYYCISTIESLQIKTMGSMPVKVSVNTILFLFGKNILLSFCDTLLETSNFVVVRF